MKDLLYDFYIDPFKDGIVGVLLGLCIWVASLIVAFLIYLGGYYAVNYIGTGKQFGYGRIIKSEFIPAHSTTTFMPVGKGGLMPVATWYPDSYQYTIQSDQGTGTVSEENRIFFSIPEGTRVKISYSYGRFNGNFVINEIIKD